MTKYLSRFTLSLPSTGPFRMACEVSGANPHDWLNREICNSPSAVFGGASTPEPAYGSRRCASLERVATSLAAL